MRKRSSAEFTHGGKVISLAFADIIAPETPQKFSRSTFGALVRHYPRAEQHRCLNLDFEAFERLLWCHERELPDRLAVHSTEGGVDLPRRAAAKDLFRWAVDRYAEGCTLRFDRIQEVDPLIAGLARDLSQTLLADVFATALLLPADTQARNLGWASDCDHLIIQTTGNSTWRWSLTMAPADGAPSGGGHQELHAGDALYLPHGAVVEVSTQDPAVSVVFVIRPFTTGHLLECLIEVATEADVLLRRSAPAEQYDLDVAYRSALGRLNAHVRDSEMVANAWRRLRLRIADQHKPTVGGHLAALASLPTLETSSRVEAREGALFARGNLEEGLYLYVPGLGGVRVEDSEPGGLMLPHSASSLLEELEHSRRPFSAQELSDDYSMRARMALVRKLLREGVLRIAASPRQNQERRP